MQTDFLAALDDRVDDRVPADLDGQEPDAGPPAPASRAGRAEPLPDGEAAARRLEATGRFRVLRRLERRPVRVDGPAPDGRTLRLGVVLDVETTGLDARAEIIEVAGLRFTYDDGGIRDVVGEFEALQEPSRGLPPEIVRLTGLTDADVRGRSIDRAAFASFVRPAALVIAHNAGFDRPFCERLDPNLRNATWACSATDVGWKALGHDGARLGQLLADVGYFHGAHRALDDCHAVIGILSATRSAGGRGAFAQLLAAAGTEAYELRAERAPYDMREYLKQRGYRWSPGTDGRPKCWVKTVGSAALGAEMHWLRHEIYRDEALPVVRKLGPGDRFR